MADSKEAQFQQDIISAMVAQGWLTFSVVNQLRKLNNPSFVIGRLVVVCDRDFAHMV